MTLRFSLAALLFLSLSGCGLIPVPYFVNATGPIRSVRVVDAVDGTDIAEANVTFHSGLGMTNWIKYGGSIPMVPSNEKAELADTTSRLARKPDGTYRVPKRNGVGLIRPFGPTPLGWALYNPPVSIIAVLAPGYHSAGLLYYPESPPEPGWTKSVTDSSASTAEGEDTKPGAVSEEVERYRCQFDADGILKFYLHRVPPSHTPSATAQAQSPPVRANR